MKKLRFLTAGESHGPALTGILEGLPAGLALKAEDIDYQLSRRQKGHGRGGRMKIESDKVRILGGVRHGRTLGSPLALSIENKDWKNWSEAMRVEPGGDEALKRVHVPRPGHADLVGGLKYGHTDLRNVLERASARETAMRVALASAARLLLAEFGIRIASRVVSIGGAEDSTETAALSLDDVAEAAEKSPVRCLDEEAASRMIAEIDAAKKDGDTLGGVFEVLTEGLPPGLGSYAQWDRRAEGELARAFMSLNAIKGVEVGLGFSAARRRGSEVHDEYFLDEGGGRVVRKTNRSGGVDGGMTTGERVALRAAMKPIATLMKPIASVDLEKREPADAHVERSDFCAVAAAAVIGESLAALVLADLFLDKFGGDSIEEVRAHFDSSRTA